MDYIDNIYSEYSRDVFHKLFPKQPPRTAKTRIAKICHGVQISRSAAKKILQTVINDAVPEETQNGQQKLLAYTARTHARLRQQGITDGQIKLFWKRYGEFHRLYFNIAFSCGISPYYLKTSGKTGKSTVLPNQNYWAFAKYALIAKLIRCASVNAFYRWLFEPRVAWMKRKRTFRPGLRLPPWRVLPWDLYGVKFDDLPTNKKVIDDLKDSFEKFLAAKGERQGDSFSMVTKDPFQGKDRKLLKEYEQQFATLTKLLNDEFVKSTNDLIERITKFRTNFFPTLCLIFGKEFGIKVLRAAKNFRVQTGKEQSTTADKRMIFFLKKILSRPKHKNSAFMATTCVLADRHKIPLKVRKATKAEKLLKDVYETYTGTKFVA